MATRMGPAVFAVPEENKSHHSHKLCSTCEKTLNRPEHHWDANRITQIGYSKRSYDDIMASANNGCLVCKHLQSSILASPNLQSQLMESGMSCTLHWNKEADKFDNIRFSKPLVNFKLLLEEDVSFLVYGKENELANTSSDACLNLATNWIMNCTKTHPECSRRIRGAGWLPTRLIEIETLEGIHSARLVITTETRASAERADYVALTHRWGSNQNITLTSKNMGDLQRRIPIEELPKTFSDAIRFTKHLGIRYLWIDSLCIQQDSEHDWQNESSVMGNVYERSYCNIAATAAAAGHEGLFVDRDILSQGPFMIKLNWKGHQRVYYCLYSDLWHLGVTKTPLNRRGWVLQERLLSPRTLSFNTQLFWECRLLRACESFPQGLGPDESFAHDDVDEDLELCSKAWMTEATDPHTRYNPWTRVIQQFMVCQLTKDTDKLIAVSGIAKAMQTVLDDNCVAGLWERNLTFDLLWYVEKRRRGDCRDSFRVEPYRAPSWSWASVEGRVHFAYGRRDYSWGPPLVKILTIDIESTTQDATGQLKHGCILASGLLLRFHELKHDYTLDLIPGVGTATCVDDWRDMVLEDLSFLPVRSMESANGVELLGLILTPKSDGFRRVGLLSVSRDDLGDFGWDNVFEWDEGHCSGLSTSHICWETLLKLV